MGRTRAFKAFFIAVLASLVPPPAAMAQDAPTRCGFTSSPPPPARMAAPAEGATPSRLEERAVRFARGGDRGPSDRTIVLSANPPLTADAKVFAETTGDLDKEDASDSFAEEGVVVQSSITGAGDLRLKICIDPERPEKVEFGRYVGSIRVAGSAVQPSAVAVEVTMRRGPVLAIILLFLGSLLGIVAKAFGDRKSANETAEAARSGTSLSFAWGDYLKSPGFVGGFLGGVVLAIIAYAQVYAADPDWGTALDMVALGLAGAASQVSGRTVADVVAPYVPKPKPAGA